jgi:hypothetical protein
MNFGDDNIFLLANKLWWGRNGRKKEEKRKGKRKRMKTFV